MSFRQFGGLNFAARNNIVSSNYNTSNNLLISQNFGQPNSYVNFLSDISGNINVDGTINISENLNVGGNVDISGNLTANYMFLSSGNNYSNESNAVMPKSYIDLVGSGIKSISEVIVISTFDSSSNNTKYPVPINSDVSSNFMIDGITLQNNYLVLLNDQGVNGKGISVNNGIYYYKNTSGTNYQFIRNNDSSFNLPTGSNAAQALVLVEFGNVYSGSTWLQTYINPNTNQAIVGTDPLNFQKFFNLNFKIGNGLYKTTVDNVTYLNVDPSLNLLYSLDGSYNSLNVGTQNSTTQLNLGRKNINTIIDASGVGINTFNPEYVFDVSGNARFSDVTFIGPTSNPTNTLGILKVELTGANLLVYKDVSNNYTSLVNTGGNTIEIGSTSFSNNLVITGTTTSTSFNTPSDYRLKENIENLDDNYSVDNLRPVYYNNKKTKQKDIGLIAHELQEQYSFLVNGEKDGNEFQSVNYNGLIGILIKEIKELKIKVKNLEKKIY